MRVWDGHLANPILPRALKPKLAQAGFADVNAKGFVQLETNYDESSASAVLIRLVDDYVVSQGVPKSEADSWASELRTLGGLRRVLLQLVRVHLLRHEALARGGQDEERRRGKLSGVALAILRAHPGVVSTGEVNSGNT